MEQSIEQQNNFNTQPQVQETHPLEEMPSFEQHMQDMESNQLQESALNRETSSEFTTNNPTAEDIYRKIAKDALKNWNGLSDEEAEKKSRESSHEELEYSIDALTSILAANDGICEALKDRGLVDDEERYDLRDGLEEIVCFDDDYTKEHPDWAKEEFDNTLRILTEKLEQVPDKETFVLDVLDNIHDKWIADNMEKLNDPKRVNKRYQFMPLSIIGFGEAKADLLFARPILEAAGMGVDEEKLKNAYEDYDKYNARKLFKPEKRYNLDKYSISRTIENADPQPYAYVWRNLYARMQSYRFHNDEYFSIDINNTTGEDFMIQERRRIKVGPEWGAPDRYASDWENQQAREEADQGWAVVTDSREPTEYEYTVRYAAEIANQIIDKLQK